MTTNRPPYVGSVKIQDWITKDRQRIKGIQLRGASGIAAHLTADEARELADTLHDLSDRLEAPQRLIQRPTAPQPIHSTHTELTAADGTLEPTLPATIAD